MTDASERKPHVIIVGGAVAGASLALALRSIARRVDVLEQRPSVDEMDLDEPASVGFALLPNVCAILHSDQLQSGGFNLTKDFDSPFYDGPSNRQTLRSFSDGETLVTSPIPSPAATVHRKTFITKLIQLAMEAGDVIRYHWGSAVAADGVDTVNGIVTTTDGRVFKADLIVGCDGVQSQVRKAILRAHDLPSATSVPLGVSLARFSVPKSQLPTGLKDDLFEKPGGNDGCVVTYHHDEGRIVIYPMRQSDGLVNVVVYFMSSFPGAIAIGDLKASEQHIIKGDEFPKADDVWVRGGTEILRGIIDHASPCKTVQELLSTPTRVSLWQLRRLCPLPFWSAGKAVILGDAAHPMAPFQGSGAAMALEDVEALALLLRTAVHDDVSDYTSIFDPFYRTRFLRSSIVQLISDQTPFPQEIIQANVEAMEKKEKDRSVEVDEGWRTHVAFEDARKRVFEAMHEHKLDLNLQTVARFSFTYPGFEDFLRTPGNTLIIGEPPRLTTGV